MSRGYHNCAIIMSRHKLPDCNDREAITQLAAQRAGLPVNLKVYAADSLEKGYGTYHLVGQIGERVPWPCIIYDEAYKDPEARRVLATNMFIKMVWVWATRQWNTVALLRKSRLKNPAT